MSRKDYVPGHNVERFIVPLLKESIDAFIIDLPCDVRLRVLDVGCGKQPFRSLVEEHHEYTAIDHIDQVSDGSVTQLPIDSNDRMAFEGLGKFDVVLCTEVLEHVFDLRQAFENFKIISKKGTIVFISSPFFYPLHEEPYDHWRLTPYTLRKLAYNADFAVKVERRLGSALEVVGTALATINYIESKGGGANLSTRILNRIRGYALGWIVKNHQKYQAFSNMYLSNLFVIEKQ